MHFLLCHYGQELVYAKTDLALLCLLCFLERCLLYSMKMFGDQIYSLCIASGTIFNEVNLELSYFPLHTQLHPVLLGLTCSSFK